MHTAEEGCKRTACEFSVIFLHVPVRDDILLFRNKGLKQRAEMLFGKCCMSFSCGVVSSW